MIHHTVQAKMPQVVSILQKHRVKRAYAFGTVCTDAYNDKSDIDILVAFDMDEPFEGYSENFWKMEDALSQLLSRNVELIPEHTLKNPYVIHELEKNKVEIFCL